MPMIDSISNLLFRCSHQRLTRPMTPVGRSGQPERGTYVLCLDCGKQFPYDLQEMRIGKPLSPKADSGVLAPTADPPPKSKIKVAATAAVVPAVFFLWRALTRSRQSRTGAPPPVRKRGTPPAERQ